MSKELLSWETMVGDQGERKTMNCRAANRVQDSSLFFQRTGWKPIPRSLKTKGAFSSASLTPSSFGYPPQHGFWIGDHRVAGEMRAFKLLPSIGRREVSVR
jgi:hypothetical protein